MDEGISKFFHSQPGLAESLAPASMLTAERCFAKLNDVQFACETPFGQDDL